MNEPSTEACDAVSRRAFIAGMTAAGVGLAAMPLAAHASGRPLLNITNIPDNGKMPGIPGRSPTERVLNYALTLEHMEADIYRQALNVASGQPIDSPLPSSPSGLSLSVPANMDALNAQLGFAYIRDFAAVEAAHRDFLIAAITQMGHTPVGPHPGGYVADFGPGDLRSILMLLRNVEETGVRAYLGAAQFITSTKVIQTAASIYSTEARHSAALNLILGESIGPSRRCDDSIAVWEEHGDNNFEHWQDAYSGT